VDEETTECSHVNLPGDGWSQILLSGGSNLLAKDGTEDGHVGRVEGIHEGLDPGIVDVEEEVLNGLLGGGGGRIEAGKGGVGAGASRPDGSDTEGRGSGGGGGGRGVGGGQQHELDVGGSEEGGDVGVGEAVDGFQIPTGARTQAVK
jgi:hypothetical protein